MDVESTKGSFYQTRGNHRHEAVDILAPRNTAIQAVEDGTIARLFDSKAGGLMIYQKDPHGKFVYLYAHLERFATGLKDGDQIRRDQVIGYVGTSGNAPPNTPHLHFAINEITQDGDIYHGPAIDPYAVFAKSFTAHN
ncbi:MAG: M23 family metallopeptidase [Cyanobacteria bacterium]|nr:M23 family metallopeptidase [Cyanobacteriota bacterium]